MPNIIYEAGQLSREKKSELIRALTQTAAGITAVPATSFNVLIKENPIENWGIGGEPLEEIIRRKTMT